MQIPTPDKIAEMIPPPVHELCRRLRQAGKRSWVVGGSIRDLLLHKKVSDYDVCTDALPQEVQQIFPKVIPTGIEHGTVTVMLNGQPYEVTTLRGEGAYTDGRHPDQVHYLTEITEDLARRDFTVNAIAFDLETFALIDPFGGLNDLEQRVIRAVGIPQERFNEDGLRILRATRFVSILEASLDPSTESAIQGTLHTFRKVSPERIRDEWLKTMKAHRPSRSFDVMLRTGILDIICPELVTTHGCEQNRWHAFDVWGHSMACLDACSGDAILRMAALFHDIGKPQSRALNERTHDFTFYEHERIGAEIADPILLRLRFSNEERQRIVHLVRHHLICYDDTWTDSAVRRWIKRVTRDRMEDLYELCRADVLGKGRPAPEELERVAKLEVRATQILAAGDALSTRALKINGNDLMKELGIKPGRRVGQLLEELLEQVLEEPRLNNREQLLELARTLEVSQR